MRILSREDSLLLIVDIQDRLVNALDKDIIVTRASKVVEAAKILNIPVVVTEQYPNGLGHTVQKLSEKLPKDAEIIEKCAFSVLREPGFAEKLQSYGRKQIIMCGIETHICVHQTCADLLDAGYQVFVIKDACASRSKYEFKQGIELMQQNGAVITCVEIALFEWLKTAKHPQFKTIQALIK